MRESLSSGSIFNEEEYSIRRSIEEREKLKEEAFTMIDNVTE